MQPHAVEYANSFTSFGTSLERLALFEAGEEARKQKNNGATRRQTKSLATLKWSKCERCATSGGGGPLLLLLLLLLCALLCATRAQHRPLMAVPPLVEFAPMAQMAQMAQQPQHQQPLIAVAGSEPLLRHAERVDQLILPYANFTLDERLIETNSYVIDHKRFVEPYATRCMSSTVLEDPDAFEPAFIIIKENSELRINATAPMELIQQTGFEPRQRTTIFVHGFTQSYPATDWLRKIRALYERNALISEQNLIIMDWGAASHGSYSQVAARVSAMGSFLANFLMKLIELGAERMAFHLIGHSLGAHVAGFAGKRMRPRKLGRITALDPAGPCFGKLFSNSPTDRLSAEDAHEVDVHHYDDNFLGLPGQHGQWDVYVNGGSSQPGAVDNVNAMVQALITMVFRRNRALSESHTRSTDVATSQLSDSACQQVAYECKDWPAFLSGECGLCDQQNSQCFFMGFPFQYANMETLPLRQQFPPKRLYIATSAYESFCLQHYQIVARFEASTEMNQQAKRHKWRLLIELISDQGNEANFSMTNQMAPNLFSYLLLSEQRPIKFTSALLQVRSSLDNSLVPLRQHAAGANKQGSTTGGGAEQPPIKLLSIEVNFMSDINPQARKRLSSRLCPVGWVPHSMVLRGRGQKGPPNELANNLVSLEPNDDWLAFDECDHRRF